MPKLRFLFARTWIKKKKNQKKFFNFFLNFTFFRFEKSHPKIKNSKKGLSTASQNTFKIKF